KFRILTCKVICVNIILVIKMTHIKRFVLLLIVLFIVASSAACGGGENTATTDKPENEISEALKDYVLDSEAVLDSMPEELKNTKLTWYNWEDITGLPEEKLIAQFEEKTGIDVEVRIVNYSKYVDLVAGMLTVGETPDVLRMRSSSIGMMKLLQPISCTGYDFSGKEWDQSISKTYSYGEKCYGVNLFYTHYMMADLLVYNPSTMETMGFEDPWTLWKNGKWTWDKMKEMTTTWVEQGTDYIGACLWPYNAPCVTRGGSFTIRHPDGTYELDLLNENNLKGWRFTLDGIAANLFTNINDGVDLIKQQTLFGSMSASIVRGAQTTNDSIFPKMRRRGNFAVVPHPKWEDAEYCLPIGEWTAFGIPKAAKNPKAVPYFLAWICNLDNCDLSIYDKETNPYGYFYSQQTKDCYMDVLAIENRSTTNNGCLDYSGEFGSPFDFLIRKYISSTQLNTWLQTKKPILDNSINMFNEDALKLN
ncbi:MAG: extracellular solute-binding protein, partial [Clostridiales bacterium]|nr:extracellular solute-binding protein [Candidatus Equinaster intestinalis]